MNRLENLDDGITNADPNLVLVTSDSNGVAGNGYSQASFLTDTFFVFTSNATNLVSGDGNGDDDIFVKDLTTGTTLRVSLTSTNGEANGNSSFAGVTTNGQGLLFTSNATNLFAGGSGNGGFSESLFYKNLQTGAVQQVDSSSAGVHGNGMYSFGQFMPNQAEVLVTSDSSNLVSGDTNNSVDVFIKNLGTGDMTLVSSNSSGVIGNGISYASGSSSDGNIVYMLSSASNLVSGDSNGGIDTFTKNLTTGAVTRLTTTAAGAQINGNSYSVLITGDAQKMLFISDGGNVVAGDTNKGVDIFLKNLGTGAVTAVSSSSAGVVGNLASNIVTGTQDAGKVVFDTAATNLVTGDSNGTDDLYLKDTSTGALTRIFAAAPYRAGDSYTYTAQFAANDTKLVLEVDYTNTQDQQYAIAHGGVVLTTTSIYVIDLASLVSTLLTSGATGTFYDNGIATATFTDGYRFDAVSPDGQHLLLDSAQSYIDFTDPNPTLPATNAYLTTLTDTALAKTVGDAKANTLVADDHNSFMFGFAGGDTISGANGDDYIDGGTGKDYMRGYAGNDTYVVDDAGDVVKEYAGQGTDTVKSSIGYILTANVENLTLTGTANINGTGNELVNVLIGNAGNNILNGAAGADTMTGGLGDDTYIVDNAHDVVTEDAGAGTDTVISSLNYALGANIENLTLTGTATNGLGNGLNNVITGTSGNNALAGGDGNDTLNGGGGADVMKGGTGDDTYITDGGDTITEYTNQGTDTVKSSVTYTLGANIENLTLTGTSNINGTGNAFANILTGNAGNNILDGGAGADTMTGGMGNDTYVVDNAADVIVEAVGGGIDTVKTALSYSLSGTQLENITLTGSGTANASGNSFNNVLTGNGGNNVLNGSSGADTMVGHAGNDTYYVDNVGDVVTEALNEGTDLVNALISYSLTINVENLTLIGTTAINGTGNSLANVLIGNSAANILDGGTGNDTLKGGTGADTFLFGASSGVDTITDFSAAQNDHINVNAYTHGTAHTAYITQAGGDVHITLGGGNVITVTAATVADVSAHMVW